MYVKESRPASLRVRSKPAPRHSHILRRMFDSDRECSFPFKLKARARVRLHPFRDMLTQACCQCLTRSESQCPHAGLARPRVHWRHTKRAYTRPDGELRARAHPRPGPVPGPGQPWPRPGRSAHWQGGGTAFDSDGGSPGPTLAACLRAVRSWAPRAGSGLARGDKLGARAV